MTKDRIRSLYRIFLIPLLIFAISVAGLIMALIVEGKADFFAGSAAAAPVAVLIILKVRSIKKVVTQQMSTSDGTTRPVQTGNDSIICRTDKH